MKVRMKIQIGGYRGGEPWPGPGEVVDVSDSEAFDLVASGYAESVNAREVTTNEETPADDPDGPVTDGDSPPVPDDSKPARKRATRKP